MWVASAAEWALASDGKLTFSSTTAANGSRDTSVSRYGAGVLAFGNGTQGDMSASVHMANSSAQYLWLKANAARGLIFGANALTGLTYVSDGVLGIGNSTAGDCSGTLKLTTVQMAASGGAPTSAGTAGTAGQIIYFGGLVYFCSVTGGVGAATWNKLNMTAV
jgi:hypothetical protein